MKGWPLLNSWSFPLLMPMHLFSAIYCTHIVNFVGFEAFWRFSPFLGSQIKIQMCVFYATSNLT